MAILYWNNSSKSIAILDFFQKGDKFVKMSKLVIDNLLKMNIDRQQMIKNGFSGQKYDDVLRGKSSYKLNDLVEISKKFQLSLDYLVYGIEKSATPELSEDIQELIALYNELPERKQGEVKGFIKGILSEQREKSASRKGA